MFVCWQGSIAQILASSIKLVVSFPHSRKPQKLKSRALCLTFIDLNKWQPWVDLQVRELWVWSLLFRNSFSLELTHTYHRQLTTRELNCSLSGKDPFDDADHQAKQHKTPKIDQHVCNFLLLSFAIAKNPIKTHACNTNTKNSDENLKKQAMTYLLRSACADKSIYWLVHSYLVLVCHPDPRRLSCRAVFAQSNCHRHQ